MKTWMWGVADRDDISCIGNFCIVVGSLLMFSTAISGASQNAIPLINQPLVPDVVGPGGAGFTLTVNGTGFVSGSVVKWNGSPRPTTYVSGSRVTGAILASDIAAPHTASVTVVNPAPGGGTSNVVFFEVTAPSSSIALSAPTILSVGSASIPNFVAASDFNGDGKPDLVVAGDTSNNVSVFLGNGDGTFLTVVNYAAGTEPSSVAVGDFNGDGKPDLAVANFGSNNVSVLLGNADGTFQAAVNYAVGSAPISVAVGDFNRDGKPDLVVANQATGNNVSVLLGNGDGTFQAPLNYAAASFPQSVAVGDFNGDGKLDLAVSNANSNDVSVLLGNGDGTFQAPVNYAAVSNPKSVTVGDFNGDGNLDLVVANFATNSNIVSVLLGNGDGTFKAAVNYAAGSIPSSVAVGDLNGDGKLDLAVANASSNNVSVLLGNGDGTFQPPVNYAAGSSFSVALADFNGDGRLDLATSGVGVLLQAPIVSLSKISLTFADQVVGTSSAAEPVTLTNSNTSVLTLNISSIAITGVNASDFGPTDTCSSSLSPGAGCTITVTLTPTQIGPRTASVTITDNAAGSPQQIAVSGTGVSSGPNATLSPASLTFATQLVGTTSSAQSVTLNNYGTVTLGIISVGFTGADPGDFAQTNTCGSSVAPGASCTISVTFKPTNAGTRTGTLSITDNAAGSPQTVLLSGAGTAVGFNPTSLSFGVVRVGQTENLSTTLTNAGNTALSITSITITGTDTDEFSQTNTCGTSVGAGKFCTITVTFRPTERGGDSADVSITDNSGGSQQQVPLSGSGCVVMGTRCKTTALSSAAVQSALAAHSTAAVPSPSGPSPVGTRIMHLTDRTRADPFLVNGTKRELLVRFWYPASLTQGCQLAEYTSPAVWRYFAELAALPLPEVKTNSCLDAPIIEGAHPLVVFTHGYTGTFTDYTFILEDLASRGYVVASVDHTYEATAVEFPDGRLVKSVFGSHLANTWRTDDQSLSLALSVRSDDLKFVLDELERLNSAVDGPFTGQLDTSRIGLIGHSLGGQATVLCIEQEPRFTAGVLLDGTLMATSIAATDKPVLIMAAGREHWSENEYRLWDHLRGPRFAVNLRGTEHVTPSDAVWLAKGAVKTGSMGPEKTIAAVRDYIAAFLDAELRGRPPEHLLTGSSSDYPDAAVTTQNQLLPGKP